MASKKRGEEKKESNIGLMENEKFTEKGLFNNKKNKLENTEV